MSSIEPSTPRPSEISVPETIVPAFDLEPGLFKREGWELVLSEDGWYLLEQDRAARRITVAEAVTTFGKNGRGAVFGPTRSSVDSAS